MNFLLPGSICFLFRQAEIQHHSYNRCKTDSGEGNLADTDAGSADAHSENEGGDDQVAGLAHVYPGLDEIVDPDRG